MAIIKIGVGVGVGAQVNGVQYGPLVAETWLNKLDHVLMQDRGLGTQDHYLFMIKDLIKQLQSQVKQVIDQGNFPLMIGGDHTLSMGSLPYKEDTLVVWIDAHGDVNTFENSISHHINGMPLAHLMGYGDPRLLKEIAQPYLKADQIVYVGVRALDDSEVDFIKEHHLMMIDHHQDRSIIINQLLEKAQGFKHIHISFDLDSLDPTFAPGVSTPVADGLHPQLALEIVRRLLKSDKVRSMDIVEFNPLKETHYTIKIINQLIDVVEKVIDKD